MSNKSVEGLPNKSKITITAHEPLARGPSPSHRENTTSTVLADSTPNWGNGGQKMGRRLIALSGRIGNTLLNECTENAGAGRRSAAEADTMPLPLSVGSSKASKPKEKFTTVSSAAAR
jgi:hypothetical protein